jgi:hypothetical protein
MAINWLGERADRLQIIEDEQRSAPIASGKTAAEARGG